MSHAHLSHYQHMLSHAHLLVSAVCSTKLRVSTGPPTGGGGQLGHFAPGPSLKGAPGGPMKGPLNTCLKDRYTPIEQSDLNTLIEQSQYSSEEQCSKLMDKEIWLVMGSYCHCQQVVTFVFFFFFLVFTLQLGSRAPL